MRAAFLIHGFASDRNDFARLVPLLSARYDAVCCPNLPYHGEAEKKSKLCCDDILCFVVEEFDIIKQKYHTIDVFGFSMGGALATYLASVRQVNKLVLLAPANKYISGGFAFSTIGYYAESFFEEHNGNKKTKRKKHAEEKISTVEDVKKDFADAGKMFLKSLLPRYTPKNLSQFSKIIRCCNKNLKEIEAPALIIWGRLDQLVPKASINYVLKFCKNTGTRTVIYRDVSHYMLYSRAFFRIIDDIFSFLENTEPPLLPEPKNF